MILRQAHTSAGTQPKAQSRRARSVYGSAHGGQSQFGFADEVFAVQVSGSDSRGQERKRAWPCRWISSEPALSRQQRTGITRSIAQGTTRGASTKTRPALNHLVIDASRRTCRHRERIGEGAERFDRRRHVGEADRLVRRTRLTGAARTDEVNAGRIRRGRRIAELVDDDWDVGEARLRAATERRDWCPPVAARSNRLQTRRRVGRYSVGPCEFAARRRALRSAGTVPMRTARLILS